MGLQFLRRRAVAKKLGIAESTMYKYIAEGTFPRPIRLNSCSVAWLESEVEAWMQARVDAPNAREPLDMSGNGGADPEERERRGKKGAAGRQKTLAERRKARAEAEAAEAAETLARLSGESAPVSPQK